MIEINDKKMCMGCHACASYCPKHCISMQADAEGFLYPCVDIEICIGCNLCEKICPLKNDNIWSNATVCESYAAKNKDDNIRLQSSSGGIFTLIAETILSKGGVVCGAAFNNKFEVEHICIETKDELYRLRGSKYAQSSIGTSYEIVKKFLIEGRSVLFTGTPCQVGGLKSYLKKDYDNLVCQDIICHGVPSPEVWKKYVELREKKTESKVRKIFFRNKKHGWKTFSLRFEFENGKEYERIYDEDLFLRGFLKNLYLRPSCYDCGFKTLKRQSDITLADFWGIENIIPDMFDNNGISWVIINSSKGKELLENIKDKIIYEKVDVDKAIAYNPAITKSASCSAQRKIFFDEFCKKDFYKVMSKYCGTKGLESLKQLKRKIKRYLHHA